MVAIRFLLRLCMVLLVAGLAPMVAASPAHAVMVGSELKLCVAPVRPGQTVQALFAGRIHVDCQTPQTRFGSGDFWVVSAPLSATGDQAVRSSSLWQGSRTVYALYGDGHIVARHRTSVGAAQSLQFGAIFEDRFDARSTPLVRVAWKVENAANLRGIVIGARLATPEASAMANIALAALYAAFGGLGLALIVHHLSLWVAMGHRFQLAYCAMVTLLIAYAFTSSGAVAWVMPGLDNNDRLRFNYAFLGMTAAAALAFARTFFEAEVCAGWTGRLCTAIAAALVLTSGAYAAFAPWQIFYLDRAYAISFLLLVGFVPVFTIRAWRLRSNYLWVFALAWAAPVFFAGLRVANNFNIVPWNFWLDNSTVLSMTTEALLSSVGISYRIRLLSRQLDEARVQEMAARRLADADPLTNLLNRRAFLDRAIGRADEQVLMLLDIDHFKAVNETIGHDGGDEVLRLVARMLRNIAPATALAARLGGEEFALLMHASDRVDEQDVLALLRATRMPFDMKITASIGACSGPLASEADWTRLYRHADRALYEAKHAGRDRARRSPALVAIAA